jgi:hypothetical protein
MFDIFKKKEKRKISDETQKYLDSMTKIFLIISIGNSQKTHSKEDGTKVTTNSIAGIDFVIYEKFDNDSVTLNRHIIISDKDGVVAEQKFDGFGNIFEKSKKANMKIKNITVDNQKVKKCSLIIGELVDNSFKKNNRNNKKTKP